MAIVANNDSLTPPNLENVSTSEEDSYVVIMEGLSSLMDKLTLEWYWVFIYGISVVTITVLNVLMLCSICKNAFLRKANTHRTLSILAFRNILRSLFSLILLYITHYAHTIKGFKYSSINSTRSGEPMLCDILCGIDNFLLAFPMFCLVALAVHMFTRYPSPQLGTVSFKKFPFTSPQTESNLKTYGQRLSTLNTGFLPRESICLGMILPGVPLIMAGVIASPIILLNLTHTLQAIPDKYICKDDTAHLTFDISVFILQFCLPFLLIFFLIVGLIVRRCLQCSTHHCCNSWCKEEVILVLYFILVSGTQTLHYLPIFEEFANKVELNNFISNYLKQWISPEVARAAETAVCGISLPVLCYLILPAYRQFTTEPDPDDLKLSVPDGQESVIMTGVTTSHHDLLPASHPTTPGATHKSLEPQHQFATILTSSSAAYQAGKRRQNDDNFDDHSM